jgi:hypothetical protein
MTAFRLVVDFIGLLAIGCIIAGAAGMVIAAFGKGEK